MGSGIRHQASAPDVTSLEEDEEEEEEEEEEVEREEMGVENRGDTLEDGGREETEDDKGRRQTR